MRAKTDYQFSFLLTMSKSIIPGIVFKLPSTLFDPSIFICVHSLADEDFYPFTRLCIIEASGSNSNLYFKGQKDFIMSTLNLKIYEDAYCKLGLVRVSRQHIINPRYIKRISHTKSPEITLRGFPDSPIPVTESALAQLCSRFNNRLYPEQPSPQRLMVARLQAAWLQSGRLVPFHYLS